ncbi:MAG: redoxin domain-containing protein [Oscillospiraceae bacterium]|nr:redoxin domain-containing protein [Oscillospiraceae bacterium]
MKRKIALTLAVLLLLSSVGCTQTPASNPTEEATIWETDPTDGSTQPPTQSEPQPTATQTPTEQTQTPTVQPTQPTQPTDSTQITQPTQGTQPVQTMQPTQATQPTQSTQPTAPSTSPTQPEETQTATLVTETPTDTGCQHDYQQTYTKAATCSAEGYKKFTCRKCGAVTRQEIPIKDHSYKDATCLQPKTCTGCSRTEGAALGHSYGGDHLCIRCGAKNPSVSPESMRVDFVATVRSDEGVALAGVTVSVYTTSESGGAVTDQKGMATVALNAGSSQYTVRLSNVPEGYEVQESYSFTSAQVTINLKSLPVRSDPNDHSKARYKEGDEMMDFTMTDVDGRTYQLSQLLQENKLVILDFWYVSCNPCKKEFPYFEAALKAYGDDVVLLAVDPFYSAEDIRQLRDDMELSFPVFQDPLGLSGGFRVESYPTTVFIDSTGTIRRIHRSAFSDEASFLRAVAAYL